MGGSSGSTQQSTTVEKPSRQQENLLGGAMDLFKPVIRGNMPEMYQGSVIPGFNQAQIQGQDMMKGAAGAQQSMWDDMAKSYGSMVSTDTLDIGKNPWTQAAMQAAIRPMQESFSEVQLPGISQEAVTSGGFGGSRQGIAEGVASGKLSQAIGDTTAKMGSDLYGQQLSSLSKMMALGPQVMASGAIPGQTMGAVGSQQWTMDQAKAQEQKDLFNTEQMMPFNMGSVLAGLASGIPGGSQTSIVPGTTTSPWQSILGGGMMGASMGSAVPGIGTVAGGAGGLGLGALMALLQ